MSNAIMMISPMMRVKRITTRPNEIASFCIFLSCGRIQLQQQRQQQHRCLLFGMPCVRVVCAASLTLTIDRKFFLHFFRVSFFIPSALQDLKRFFCAVRSSTKKKRIQWKTDEDYSTSFLVLFFSHRRLCIISRLFAHFAGVRLLRQD